MALYKCALIDWLIQCNLHKRLVRMRVLH